MVKEGIQMSEIIGIVIIFLSYFIAILADTKYKVKLAPAYWYLWGSVSMSIGLFISL